MFAEYLSSLPNFSRIPFFKPPSGGDPGAGGWEPERPQADFFAGSPPGGDFSSPLGGQRLDMLLESTLNRKTEEKKKESCM